MPKFLSEQWARAVSEALNEDARFAHAARDVDVTIQQIVTNVPAVGESRYWTRIADGRIETRTGDAPDPDVRIEQDYETAVALNRGELHPQSALLQGRLKVNGNFGKLLEQHVVIDVIAPIIAGLPTEY